MHSYNNKFFLKSKLKKIQTSWNEDPAILSSQLNTNDHNTDLTPEEKGIEKEIMNHAGKAEKNRQAIKDMVSNSNRIILSISSVFPLDFFPNNIIVEEKRLTIVSRQFFSTQTHSVDIKNITNIFIDTGILFAQLTIVSDTFTQNQIVIKNLWKKEAIFMRRIIEGLRMFVEKDIDTTSFGVDELINKLKELNTTKIAF